MPRAYHLIIVLYYSVIIHHFRRKRYTLHAQLYTFYSTLSHPYILLKARGFSASPNIKTLCSLILFCNFTWVVVCTIKYDQSHNHIYLYFGNCISSWD